MRNIPKQKSNYKINTLSTVVSFKFELELDAGN